MKRAELYRVKKGDRDDPKRSRVFVIVSRQILVDSAHSTVICAPIHSSYDGLSTQVQVGVDEGLKHQSSIHCDGLVSLPKAALTDFVGNLKAEKIGALNDALGIALGLK